MVSPNNSHHNNRTIILDSSTVQHNIQEYMRTHAGWWDRVIEPPEDEALDINAIRRFTGDDVIRARDIMPPEFPRVNTNEYWDNLRANTVNQMRE